MLFLQAAVESILVYGCTSCTLHRKKWLMAIAQGCYDLY